MFRLCVDYLFHLGNVLTSQRVTDVILMAFQVISSVLISLKFLMLVYVVFYFSFLPPLGSGL